MTFESLHEDTECDCLGNAFEETEKLFARKISKPNLRVADFYSHWERRKRPQSMICGNICLFKGISINEWNDDTSSKIIEKYIDGLGLQDLDNKIRESILIFKFNIKSGLLKPSPTKKDPSHYTFYKDDGFSIENIEIINTIELRNYV